MIIDFHTHAFPDTMAKLTMASLSHAGKITPKTSGTTEALLTSMDTTGIDASIVCTIATKPSQFDTILKWLKTIRSKRLIPLPSIHPDDQLWSTHLQQVADEGFPGIKMHPFYQSFALDEKRLFPLYEGLNELEMILMLHCGHDFAYPPSRRASPEKILLLHQNFPKIKLLATHMGGWKMWDEVETTLLGKKIYFDTSFSLGTLPQQQAKAMIAGHPKEYILFGSDSPWDDQKKAHDRVKTLNLTPEMESRILGENARTLLQFP